MVYVSTEIFRARFGWGFCSNLTLPCINMREGYVYPKLETVKCSSFIFVVMDLDKHILSAD